MHIDEVETDESLVRRLVGAQFPEWAGLVIRPVQSAGTDHALYRLGNEMVVRLPRILSASAQVNKEQQWLPRFAPLLPLAIPYPLAMGKPAEGYPWHWSVCRWIGGKDASVTTVTDEHQAAIALAEFLLALQKIDPTGGPLPGKHNFFRGVPLAMRDSETQTAIDSLRDRFDADLMLEVWKGSLGAPRWNKPPCWIHGDLMSQLQNYFELSGHEVVFR